MDSSNPKDNLVTLAEYTAYKQRYDPEARHIDFSKFFNAADSDADKSLTFEEFKVLKENERKQTKLMIKL